MTGFILLASVGAFLFVIGLLWPHATAYAKKEPTQPDDLIYQEKPSATILPNKRVSWWVLTLPEVDAYLIKSVKFGPMLARKKNVRSAYPSVSTIEVEFYDTFPDDVVKTSNAMGPLKSVQQWLLAARTDDASIKFLDEVGNVRELWAMKVEPVQVVPGKLAYAEGGLLTATLLLNIKSLDISYPTGCDKVKVNNVVPLKRSGSLKRMDS